MRAHHVMVNNKPCGAAGRGVEDAATRRRKIRSHFAAVIAAFSADHEQEMTVTAPRTVTPPNW